ncbi:hypothetical protein O6H91_06G019900 [Diphasiastrum complanatum]|uniref:Uncharacterized protein n=1 Tax=Diphasiastrum complanatum TaxID=34168 RepID=A0ACC2DBH9_DIPCM|nr:hypothetical protein O6H91_06G019900 [Diphasiastrum complanatum]
MLRKQCSANVCLTKYLGQVRKIVSYSRRKMLRGPSGFKQSCSGTIPCHCHSQEIFQLENELVFNEAVIEERDQGIKEIQQQIGEVNDIFKDLAVMVHDQGIVIDDIDSNIESSHSVTVQANRQLVKASKTQRSNNSLSCLLIVIFAVALLIVIIVLAA